MTSTSTAGAGFQNFLAFSVAFLADVPISKVECRRRRQDHHEGRAREWVRDFVLPVVLPDLINYLRQCNQQAVDRY
jgi:hypothetical protein